MFQSTRPRGARPDRAAPSDDSFCVSIHAPARGATRPLFLSLNAACVSIHAPARGATDIRAADGARSQVSIHAPARGATKPPRLVLRNLEFQSTRPRGARPQAMQTIGGCACFNPRAREGRD